MPGNSPNHYRGPPTTFANMRAQGMSSLGVVRDIRHLEASSMWTAMAMRPEPAFGPRMVYTSCRETLTIGLNVPLGRRRPA